MIIRPLKERKGKKPAEANKEVKAERERESPAKSEVVEK